MAKQVLVLHGANLNLLGKREPEVYGHMTLDELNNRVMRKGEGLGFEVRCLQFNLEGELVNALARCAKLGGRYRVQSRWLYSHIRGAAGCDFCHFHTDH